MIGRRNVLKLFAAGSVTRGKKMPFGQSRGQGFNNSEIVIADKVIVEGADGGLFIYNGTAGPGNPPIVSIADSTVDPFGNPIQPQFQSNDGSGNSIYINGAVLGWVPSGSNLPGQLQTAAGETILVNSTKIGGFDTPGEIAIFSELASGTGNSQIQLLAGQVSVNGGASLPLPSAGVVTLAQLIALLKTGNILS